MRYEDIPDYYGDAEGYEDNGAKVTAFDTLNEIYEDEAYGFMGEYFEKKENRNAYAVSIAAKGELWEYIKYKGNTAFGEFVKSHMELIHDGMDNYELAAEYMAGLARRFAAEDEYFYDWLEDERESSAKDTKGAA